MSPIFGGYLQESFSQVKKVSIKYESNGLGSRKGGGHVKINLGIT